MPTPGVQNGLRDARVGRRAHRAHRAGRSVGLSAWPANTRLILRRERSHPGAQLRITDIDGMRITGLLTNTPAGGPADQLADFELRHRGHSAGHHRADCTVHLIRAAMRFVSYPDRKEAAALRPDRGGRAGRRSPADVRR